MENLYLTPNHIHKWQDLELNYWAKEINELFIYIVKKL